MDLNGDGNIDLLSASFAGFPYIFYGNKDNSFNESVILKDKSGANITLDMYWDFEFRGYVNLEKEENGNKGDFIKAHDWDNDGDLDLIISGNKVVKLRINEGTKTNPVFGTENVEVIAGHFADALVDWDGDGLWDIVGGSKKGGVYFYKNTGKLGNPVFDEAECLIEPNEFINKTNGGRCGITQIAVADYNNDGKLDILIGNQNIINEPMPGLTAEQIKKNKLLVKKLEKKYSDKAKECKDYIEAFRIKYKKENIEIIENDKAFAKLQDEKTQITQELIKARPKTKTHGYVWVNLRK